MGSKYKLAYTVCFWLILGHAIYSFVIAPLFQQGSYLEIAKEKLVDLFLPNVAVVLVMGLIWILILKSGEKKNA